MESLEQKYAQRLENSNLSLKQRQVLLSSLKLFSEIGFENTTASLIAKEAGVSEGTVFSYFKTKEGILEAILSEETYSKPREFFSVFEKYCSG